MHDTRKVMNLWFDGIPKTWKVVAVTLCSVRRIERRVAQEKRTHGRPVLPPAHQSKPHLKPRTTAKKYCSVKIGCHCDARCPIFCKHSVHCPYTYMDGARLACTLCSQCSVALGKYALHWSPSLYKSVGTSDNHIAQILSRKMYVALRVVVEQACNKCML